MTLVHFVLPPRSRTIGTAQAEDRALLKSNSSADLGTEGEERPVPPLLPVSHSSLSVPSEELLGDGVPQKHGGPKARI